MGRGVSGLLFFGGLLCFCGRWLTDDGFRCLALGFHANAAVPVRAQVLAELQLASVDGDAVSARTEYIEGVGLR